MYGPHLFFQDCPHPLLSPDSQSLSNDMPSSNQGRPSMRRMDSTVNRALLGLLLQDEQVVDWDDDAIRSPVGGSVCGLSLKRFSTCVLSPRGGLRKCVDGCRPRRSADLPRLGPRATPNGPHRSRSLPGAPAYRRTATRRGSRTKRGYRCLCRCSRSRRKRGFNPPSSPFRARPAPAT